MSGLIEGKGHCLCGEVRINAKKISTSVGACHCDMCRKWGGGPYMAIDCGTEVSFEGDENIATFGSSEWADRGFCKKCGTHLFYKLKENGQLMMSLGLFDEDQSFVFDHQVFIDEKSALYSFTNQTNDMTGAELFAKFAPP